MLKRATAIWSVALCACVVHADDVTVSPDAADQVTLSFDSLYTPSQPHWRETVTIDMPVLIPSGDRVADANLVIGFMWVDDALASKDLDLWLTENASMIDDLGLIVGRSTVLRDGGIDGVSSTLGEEHLAGYAETSGEFDLYNISLLIGSLGSDRLGVDLITGLRAVQARVGHSFEESDTTGTMHTTLDIGRGVVAIPILGTGVYWQANELLRFSGSASTHTISQQATFYDLSAEAELRLRPNVGLVAGYQFVRSVMEVRNVPAELNEEGLFARIQIRF